MIKKISSGTTSIISTDCVVYLQEINFDIGTMEDLKAFDEGISCPQSSIRLKLQKMNENP